MGKENVVYRYSRIIFGHKKGNPAICDNMDGPAGHYAKRNKSEKGKCHLGSLTWSVKESDSQHQRGEGWMPGSRESRIGEMLVKGTNVLLQEEYVRRI